MIRLLNPDNALLLEISRETLKTQTTLPIDDEEDELILPFPPHECEAIVTRLTTESTDASLIDAELDHFHFPYQLASHYHAVHGTDHPRLQKLSKVLSLPLIDILCYEGQLDVGMCVDAVSLFHSYDLNEMMIQCVKHVSLTGVNWCLERGADVNAGSD